MTVVVHASTVISALVDNGPEGQWAEQILLNNEVFSPMLLQVECSNVLRRLTAGGKISDLEGSMSHRDLMSRPITLLPFDPFADRVWALRNNVSSYDAWYVAMAEALDMPLVTLDTKLTNAPGPTCTFDCFTDH